MKVARIWWWPYIGKTGETSDSFYSNWAYLTTIAFFQSNTYFFCQTKMLKVSFNILTFFDFNLKCLKSKAAKVFKHKIPFFS